VGKIICTGLGPGDPDLISVRSDRLIRAARHVAYFRKAGRPGQARRIVEGMLAADVTEYPMEYPVTTELPFGSAEYNRLLASFYDDWATRLAGLAAANDVVVLCEGDPLFYGSFMQPSNPAAAPRRGRDRARDQRHDRMLERDRHSHHLG